MNGFSSSIRNRPYLRRPAPAAAFAPRARVDNAARRSVFVNALTPVLATATMMSGSINFFQSGVGPFHLRPTQLPHRRSRRQKHSGHRANRAPGNAAAERVHSRRQVNQNVAPVAQNAGLELRMRLNNAGQCVFIFHRTADLSARRIACATSSRSFTEKPFSSIFVAQALGRFLIANRIALAFIRPHAMNERYIRGGRRT
jgi:hypothetical protein